MADFKTHITGSTLAGVAYGYWGVAAQGMSMESALIAGGLCSVSGMLPDLDSDSGIPLRETSMFAAAIIPVLMIERFRDMGMSNEAMAIGAMLVYVAIRFIGFEIFKRFTVHRGMWHSLPAAGIAGLLAYLINPCLTEGIRVYKAMAVVTGFLVHLILDEIWAVDFRLGRFRLKKSFGTALKLLGGNWPANLMVWGIFFALAYIAWGDVGILDRIRQRSRMEEPYLAEPYWLPTVREPTFRNDIRSWRY